MPTSPSSLLTEEQQYFRNNLNLQFGWDDFQKLNEKLPQNLKWEELGYGGSVLHKFDLRRFEYEPQGNNRKYVSACGHFEVVYTKENYMTGSVLHAPYMGTYNYYGYKNADKHFLHDMVTWFYMGTVEAR